MSKNANRPKLIMIITIKIKNEDFIFDGFRIVSFRYGANSGNFQQQTLDIAEGYCCDR